MRDLIVGIDPDVDRSGIAVYHKATKDLQLSILTFFQLFDFLKDKKSIIREVIVEGGWLHKKSNFRNEHSGQRVAARIGKNTGANHETGRKIIEMCAYLKIECRAVLPLVKRWKGLDRKISHEEFFKLTGYNKRTNQEQRDAALLVWGY